MKLFYLILLVIIPTLTNAQDTVQSNKTHLKGSTKHINPDGEFDDNPFEYHLDPVATPKSKNSTPNTKDTLKEEGIPDVDNPGYEIQDAWSTDGSREPLIPVSQKLKWQEEREREMILTNILIIVGVISLLILISVFIYKIKK